MSETITLNIDDVEVTVAASTTILEAAAAAGIDIPHLCHDPAWNIPPSSSCRLCLVEVEGARAPVASCSQHAADGMVVRTDTEK
ncbi:MAG: 2Fe-2S iron-sulfur cluster-binding protein, partial [Phycisphaerae bacterium]|nr:2Fe-2S iron-sulfur cluster-binding protein [Phycisphaerae bacterium]